MCQPQSPSVGRSQAAAAQQVGTTGTDRRDVREERPRRPWCLGVVAVLEEGGKMQQSRAGLGELAARPLVALCRQRGELSCGAANVSARWQIRELNCHTLGTTTALTAVPEKQFRNCREGREALASVPSPPRGGSPSKGPQ